MLATLLPTPYSLSPSSPESGRKDRGGYWGEELVEHELSRR